MWPNGPPDTQQLVNRAKEVSEHFQPIIAKLGVIEAKNDDCYNAFADVCNGEFET